MWRSATTQSSPAWRRCSSSAALASNAFLGGLSGYSNDVPPYMLAQGTRAKLYGPNMIGLKRKGFSAAAIGSIKKAYRIIFRSGLMREGSPGQGSGRTARLAGSGASS